MGAGLGCSAGEREKGGKKKADQIRIASPRPTMTDDLEVLLLEEPAPPKEKIPEGASVALFRSNIELALRVSFVVTLLSVVVISPSLNKALNSIPGVSAWMALVPGGTLLMVVFTVYQNLGSTVQLAYQGWAGTFIACLWAHVMSAIMPYGAYGDHYNEHLMNACNIGLILCVYFLNVSKNVRMFIVSYHVFFVMALQTPTADPLMNTSWAIKWDAQTATTLGTATVGILGAIVVVLMPTPMSAKRSARDAAVSVVDQMSDMCDSLFEYYMRSAPSVSIAQIETQAKSLQQRVNSMPGTIAASWWETFDLGISGKIRVLLEKHAKMLATLVDNVLAMQICMNKEDFGPTHVQCMQKIKAEVEALLSASRGLLQTATAAAADGSIDADEESSLRSLIESTKGTISALATKFNRTRIEMFPKKVINTDLQAESFFVYCISIHARRVIEYTEDMLDQSQEAPSLAMEVLSAFKGTFDVGVLLKQLRYNSYAVRASIEVLLSYYMGLYLFNYNASAACCISLLLADFPGSAMIKNMGRLQAVVLSAVVPHLIARIQGPSCDPAIACLKAFSLFAWETIMCYIYYSSSTYGYIGCLTAAFAIGTLVYPCQHETGAEADAAEIAYSFAQYTKILQTTIAVIVMMTVDSILSPGRASDLARENLLKSLMSIDVWFQACFLKRKANDKGEVPPESLVIRDKHMRQTEFAATLAKRVFDGPRNPSDLMGYISMAEMLGAEADKEPRYYRSAFPSSFFTASTRVAGQLRANLSMLEQVLQGSKSDSLYTDIFGKIRESKPYQAVQQDVVDTLGDAIFIVQEALYNETSAPMPEVSEKAEDMEGVDKLDALDDVFKFINESGLKYPDRNLQLPNIEEDVICRINVVLMLMESSVGDVADLIKECLKVITK